MQQETTKLCSSAPLLISDQDLEQRLKNKLNDVNSFNISNIKVEEMITYSIGENHKSQKNIEP